MPSKKRKRKAKAAQSECPCDDGWVCDLHRDKPFEHDGCRSEGTEYQNPKCTKNPDSFFAVVHDCSLSS